MSDELLGAYCKKDLVISETNEYKYTTTYCREILLKDLITYFRNSDKMYDTHNFYSGYKQLELPSGFTGSFNRINNNIKKLFNINVVFSSEINISGYKYSGLFFKYMPTENYFHLTKATVSALLLLINDPNILDYLLKRNTVNLPIDTVLQRILNRSKNSSSDYYRNQLMFAIAYIKFYNTGMDSVIDTTYYNGCMSYMRYVVGNSSSDDLRKCYNYIQELVDNLHNVPGSVSFNNSFGDSFSPYRG
jgi:hypothetical protein